MKTNINTIMLCKIILFSVMMNRYGLRQRRKSGRMFITADGEIIRGEAAIRANEDLAVKQISYKLKEEIGERTKKSESIDDPSQSDETEPITGNDISNDKARVELSTSISNLRWKAVIPLSNNHITDTHGEFHSVSSRCAHPDTNVRSKDETTPNTAMDPYISDRHKQTKSSPALATPAATSELEDHYFPISRQAELVRLSPRAEARATTCESEIFQADVTGEATEAYIHACALATGCYSEGFSADLTGTSRYMEATAQARATAVDVRTARVHVKGTEDRVVATAEAEVALVKTSAADVDVVGIGQQYEARAKVEATGVNIQQGNVQLHGVRTGAEATAIVEASAVNASLGNVNVAGVDSQLKVEAKAAVAAAEVNVANVNVTGIGNAGAQASVEGKLGLDAGNIRAGIDGSVGVSVSSKPSVGNVDLTIGGPKLNIGPNFNLGIPMFGGRGGKSGDRKVGAHQSKKECKGSSAPSKSEVMASGNLDKTEIGNKQETVGSHKRGTVGSYSTNGPTTSHLEVYGPSQQLMHGQENGYATSQDLPHTPNNTPVHNGSARGASETSTGTNARHDNVIPRYRSSSRARDDHQTAMQRQSQPRYDRYASTPSDWGHGHQRRPQMVNSYDNLNNHHGNHSLQSSSPDRWVRHNSNSTDHNADAFATILTPHDDDAPSATCKARPSSRLSAPKTELPPITPGRVSFVETPITRDWATQANNHVTNGVNIPRKNPPDQDSKHTAKIGHLDEHTSRRMGKPTLFGQQAHGLGSDSCGNRVTREHPKNESIEDRIRDQLRLEYPDRRRAKKGKVIPSRSRSITPPMDEESIKRRLRKEFMSDEEFGDDAAAAIAGSIGSKDGGRGENVGSGGAAAENRDDDQEEMVPVEKPFGEHGNIHTMKSLKMQGGKKIKKLKGGQVHGFTD